MSNDNRIDRGQTEYERYAELYDPEYAEAVRPARRKLPRAKPSVEAVLDELTDESYSYEAGLKTTYQPARFEAVWLYDSLRAFYDTGMISDVLAIVKGGKEANVYRAQGGKAANAEFVAAKVYRPRAFRNLRNDKMYREGREVLGGDGKVVKKNEDRVMRALGKKTGFGAEVAHTSWLMYEYTTLQHLHAAGAAVPRPLAVATNSVLMGYIGDAYRAAPTLHEVRLERPLARRLFDAVMHNVELMLAADMIHGDLSAYNILFWDDEITLIDFPQVTNAIGNSHARMILRRDVQRVCDYFALQGVQADASAIADTLWYRFQARSENDIQADLSRLLAQFTDDEEEPASE